MKGLIKKFFPITPLRDLSFLGEETKLPLPLFAPFFSFLPYILASLKYLFNANLFLIVIFHLLSRIQLFGTPWTKACQASLSSTVSQSLLKFMSIELVILSISSSASPFFFCLQSFQHQDLFRWLGPSHQVIQVLELQLQHQSFLWIFRVDFLVLVLCKTTSLLLACWLRKCTGGMMCGREII